MDQGICLSEVVEDIVPYLADLAAQIASSVQSDHACSGLPNRKTSGA